MYIHKDEKLDEFGLKSIGFKQWYVLLEWNGKSIDKDNITTVLSAFTKNAKENDALNIKITRKNAEGIFTETVLSTKLSKIMVPMNDVLMFVPNPTADQLKMRKIWLGSPSQN